MYIDQSTRQEGIKKLHVASKERKILKIDTKNEKNKIYLV